MATTRADRNGRRGVSQLNWGGPGKVRYPSRTALVIIESVLSVAAVEGAVQLAVGVSTPPKTGLPLGLDTWLLPGAWLFASVAVPYGAAAVLAFRRDRRAPAAAQLAGAALIVELLVQIPFVGLSPLQAILALGAITTIVLGRRARRLGWRSDRSGRGRSPTKAEASAAAQGACRDSAAG